MTTIRPPIARSAVIVAMTFSCLSPAGTAEIHVPRDRIREEAK